MIYQQIENTSTPTMCLNSSITNWKLIKKNLSINIEKIEIINKMMKLLALNLLIMKSLKRSFRSKN